MKVYISAPLLRSQNDTDDVVKVLKNLNSSLEINYWRKGSSIYHDSWLNEADIVIFLLPKNRDFHCTVSTLPIGVYKEYERAKNMGKNIYFAYRRSSDNVMAIYDWKLSNNGNNNERISLLQGTTHRIAEHIIDHEYDEHGLDWDDDDFDYNENYNNESDERLLLLIQ